MNLPESIRYFRERAGMYQSDLGRFLGVSAQAVSKWELGKAEPDSTCIIKMCQLFECSANDLFGTDGTKKEPAVAGPLDERFRSRAALLTPENLVKLDAYLDGLLAGQEPKAP